MLINRRKGAIKQELDEINDSLKIIDFNYPDIDEKIKEKFGLDLYGFKN